MGAAAKPFLPLPEDASPGFPSFPIVYGWMQNVFSAGAGTPPCSVSAASSAPLVLHSCHASLLQTCSHSAHAWETGALQAIHRTSRFALSTPLV